MRAVIMLATVVIFLSFAIPLLANSKRVGFAVSERFLERLNAIPYVTSSEKPIDQTNLREWVLLNSESAKAYARYVIPMDLAFLIALGTFVGLASWTLAAQIAWPASLNVPLWIWWLLPTLYMAADLSEDILIATLLSLPSTIQEASVGLLKAFKNIKMVSVSLGLVQIIVLVCLGWIWK